MRLIASGLIAAAGLSVAIGQVALAADLPQRPVYNPPPVAVAAPVPTWTGCYVGGNAGIAFGRAQITELNSGAGVSATNSGFAGGGQIGCDYQFAGGFVVGVRDMFDATSLKSSGTFATGPFAGGVANSNTQWFNTATARIGYAVVPAGLIYLQGGGAWSRTNQNVTVGGIQSAQLANNKGGYVFGGGYEHKFAPNWSAFLEYNYLNFGTNNGTAVVAGGACPAVGCPVSLQKDMQTVLVGVNYRF